MGHKTVILIGLLAFILLCVLCVWQHYPDMKARSGLASTATLEAKLIGGKVVLNGVLPDQATKDRVVETATSLFGAGNFADKILLGDVQANAEWLAGASGLLKSANRLGTGGGITIAGDTATFSGQVQSEDERAQVISESSGSAGAFNIIDKLMINGARLFPKFSASLDDGKLTLDGIVPDQNAKDAILKQAGGAFGQGKIVDKMRVAAAGEGLTYKPDWLASITGWIGLFGRFDRRGSMAFDGQMLTVDGGVATSDIKNRLLQDVTLLMGPGIGINDQIKVAESALDAGESRIQQDLTNLVTGKSIEFDTNSDRITDAGSAVLDQIVPILRNSPDKQIEISGHTDNTGSDKLNQNLSLRRAIAVRRYLGVRGIGESRLSTTGYGSSQPIADNDSESGRARNRRIEFRVIPRKAGN